MRGELRSEYSIDGRDECRRDALMRCRTRFWYKSCQPTVRETEACLTALRLVDTLQTPAAEIDECNTDALACVETTEPDPVDYTMVPSAADAGIEP